VGDERAETYLRLLAESEARRAARGPGRMSVAQIARSVEQVRWAGNVLVTADVLEEEDVDRVAAELQAALLARSDMDRGRRMNWIFAALTGTSRAPADRPGERMLAEAAERMLASAWDDGGPLAEARLGETITVLAAAGAIAADSATPGRRRGMAHGRGDRPAGALARPGGRGGSDRVAAAADAAAARPAGGDRGDGDGTADPSPCCRAGRAGRAGRKIADT